jgi:hypothetical protein
MHKRLIQVQLFVDGENTTHKPIFRKTDYLHHNDIHIRSVQSKHCYGLRLLCPGLQKKKSGDFSLNDYFPKKPGVLI